MEKRIWERMSDEQRKEYARTMLQTPANQVPSGLNGAIGATQTMFGMDPNIKRHPVFPGFSGPDGFTMPQWVFDAARAVDTAGNAALGHAPTREEGLNFALNFGMGGLGTSAMMRNPAPGPGKTVAQTVYHGSPHNFDAFDMSKIGTGEGAQAYGHGLYVAENPNVAKSYSAMMPASGTPTPRRFFGGAELQPGSPEYHAATLMDSGRSLASVRKEVGQWVKDAESWPASRKAAPSEAAMLDGWKRTLATLNKAKSKADFVRKDSGNLYTVDLPDSAISQMLDWDKPLSQQAESVQTALRKAYGPEWEKVKNLTGGQFYKRSSPDDPWGATGQNGVGQQAADSKWLASIGIPGIKYLDGGSRGAGAGTRNFVVFDDKLLKILKKE